MVASAGGHQCLTSAGRIRCERKTTSPRLQRLIQRPLKRMVIKFHPIAAHSARPLTCGQIDDPPAASPVAEREYRKSFLPPDDGLQHVAGTVQYQHQ
ncbi:hypothetical protein R537_11355 [Salmonella enterica subsp. enterica serovar Rough O:d:1,7]|uniref:Uncharacterized protein n=1 Tax=Salmonella enterica subsp. enterica serovar Rough O:d:1,7 TaxID=1974323 RepID=A0A974KHJ7_SALET|nr:hypothetical protein [Salmonella enterica]OSD71387.1 hypothetical protein R537_11355 [Salmonella enterica subsp. enterica serovar Rough O:d:1,7]